MDAIHTTLLTKYYGKVRGVIDLDLTVRQGDFFGFIGPNGAGKSTTIRMLLGLIHPTSGSAQVLGLDVVRNSRALLSRVGYLPSESAFYPGMRVKDVLRLSANLRKTNCKPEAARLCERLQLDPMRRVEELSFGNRKKVSIICALQHCPELLILDEATSGLDPLMQQEFFAILRERHTAGATIFLSSHVLSEIQRNCTRAAIIREGRLIACDSVGALRNTAAKRVTLHGTADLSGLNGVRDLQTSKDGLSFLYSGEIQALIHVLDGSHISDLSISEPDLEEVFMHYYTDGGERE